MLLIAVSGGPGAATESFAPPTVISIPAGTYVEGSGAQEREAAYQLDEAAYGHSATRKQGWYDGEGKPRKAFLPEFEITKNLITNEYYAQFVLQTGHRRPDVTAKKWAGYGLVHPYQRAKRHIWPGDAGPAGRMDHPVVLVSFGDAEAFARWLSELTGDQWRLPSEAEWVKAARGPDGARFPWGDTFDPALLNSHDAGPFDTLPVGSFKGGASSYGLLDGAGQVFEWTLRPAGEGRHIVKGGSWDDKGCGVCRPAARHSRPDQIKHILIGFRLVKRKNITSN